MIEHGAPQLREIFRSSRSYYLRDVPCGLMYREGTVNLSGRVSRMQATGSGRWGLLPTHATDFGPDPKFLGSGSSMLGGRAVISAEVEEVIDLIVG